MVFSIISFMKKIVGWIILIIIFISSLLIGYMVNNDQKQIEKMKEKIKVNDISYINKYDDKYLVLDKDSLYLFNSKYEEIIKIDRDKLCDNINNYEIIYRNEDFQYLDDYYEKDNLVYEYYNIYNCELIEKIVLGGL